MNYIYLEGNKKFVNYLTESNEFACENFLFNDENELESQFEKENIYRQFLKGDKYVFHVSKKIINVIVYFTILYIIYISISISLINLKLDQINRKRIEIENCDDLQDGILKYYLIGKYSILLNTTEIIDRFDYF